MTMCARPLLLVLAVLMLAERGSGLHVNPSGTLSISALEADVLHARDGNFTTATIGTAAVGSATMGSSTVSGTAAMGAAEVTADVTVGGDATITGTAMIGTADVTTASINDVTVSGTATIATADIAGGSFTGVVKQRGRVETYAKLMHGPGNWPSCTEGPKNYTLGTILKRGSYNGMQTIDVTVIGNHRGWARSYHSEYRWTMIYGDHLTVIQRYKMIGNVDLVSIVHPVTGALIQELDNDHTDNHARCPLYFNGDAEIKLQIAPNCGANKQYQAIVQYTSPASASYTEFVPNYD